MDGRLRRAHRVFCKTFYEGRVATACTTRRNGPRDASLLRVPRVGHDGRAWCVECLTMVVQLEDRAAFVVRSRWNNEKTMVFGSKP